MGYARTKLEEATERVKALEANLEVSESATKDWCGIADNLENRLYVVEQQRDDLKAKLEAWERCATDEETTHVNLLRGTIVLGAAKALHYAGVQGWKTPEEYEVLSHDWDIMRGALQVIAQDIGSTHAATRAKEVLSALKK